MSVNILIADDHPMICEGIKQICSSEKYLKLIKSVRNGEQLVASYHKIIPDLIIVDISMPILDGVTAFTEIKEKFNNVKCLFYSFCGCKPEIYKLYQLGAQGYICKSRCPDEILNAINTIVSGQLYFDESFSYDDFTRYENSFTIMKSREEKRRLSKRESDIILLVAQGYSNIKISSKLNINAKVVELHQRNIKQKLGLQDSVEFIKYAIDFAEQVKNSN